MTITEAFGSVGQDWLSYLHPPPRVNLEGSLRATNIIARRVFLFFFQVNQSLSQIPLQHRWSGVLQSANVWHQRRRLFWSPTSDTKQIFSQFWPKAPHVIQKKKKTMWSVPVRPGRRWSTEPAWPSHWPSPLVCPKHQGTPVKARHRKMIWRVCIEAVRTQEGRARVVKSLYDELAVMCGP